VQPDPRPPPPTTGNTLQRALTPISNDDRTIWIRSRAQTLSRSIIQATRARSGNRETTPRMMPKPSAETNPIRQRQRSVDCLQQSQYVRALTAANEFLKPDRQAD